MSEKVRYKCLSCGYKFSRAKDSTSTKLCPYCGKTNIAADKLNEADALLKSASNPRFDI